MKRWRGLLVVLALSAAPACGVSGGASGGASDGRARDGGDAAPSRDVAAPGLPDGDAAGAETVGARDVGRDAAAPADSGPAPDGVADLVGPPDAAVDAPDGGGRPDAVPDLPGATDTALVDVPGDGADAAHSDGSPDSGLDAAVDAAGCGPDGAPCDDGVDCTTGDRCQGGVCVGAADHARCETGDPCTRGYCRPATGGCEVLLRDGAPCAGAGLCEEGRCAGGDCLLPATPCDDERVCTWDQCDPPGGCRHGLQERPGQPAPAFAAPDVNPLSATFGRTLALPVAGAVTVLTLYTVDCAPCLAQSEAARDVVAAFADEPDLVWATVNGIGAEGADGVLHFVTFDADGVTPLETTWPVLQDDVAERVYERYCGDNDAVFVVGRDGRIRYDRTVNFLDERFAAELTWQVAAALDEPR
jgi:hypothetical protein